MPEDTFIYIKGAAANNLKNISLKIPHGQLTVITGVSGSGKSSLAFEVLAREGQRRFFETFTSFSRQFMSRLSRPQVENIVGLSPVLTLSQKTVSSNTKSTVGTLSDLYGYLRLLYARLGHSETAITLSRSLFSFNSPKGACTRCRGLGLEEKISLDRLVAHPEKTLREGALAPTLPNGYIMYSQVTVDALNQVCQAHGFSVDIPWMKLTEAQQEIILNGSNKIKVPFGKHSIESRLKWTGITAKPREEGYYKGMLPIMEDILRRDRNKNILKYVVSQECCECGGSRLNESARNVSLKGKSIIELASWELEAVKTWLTQQKWTILEESIALPVIHKMSNLISSLENLGVGYLSLDRPTTELTAGETQRIRLVNQVSAELSNVLYVLDEPSVGLHPRDNSQMLSLLRQLVHKGNTVVVVEHDEDTIREADWIVDVGPGAGNEGGEVLFEGPFESFLAKKSLSRISPTYQYLHKNQPVSDDKRTCEHEFLTFSRCRIHNLQDLEVRFVKGGINVITGVGGAGKSSLVHGVVQDRIQEFLSGEEASKLNTEGIESIEKLITINQKPIGRTPRSNPATYTGLADKIRDLFARQKTAKLAGFTKSRFSFNTKGGRCETCQGAGRIQVGMHLLGNVDVECEECLGKRFNRETLTITYNGKNIFEVLELRVREALLFFSGNKHIIRYLDALDQVGLGYLQLGQPSTTLSGGEAQRVKLASELCQPESGKTVYMLDEPTTGLHPQDVETLFNAFRELTRRGNTLICIEHNGQLIRQSDWVVDLGPGSGAKGGKVVFSGPPSQMRLQADSLTAKYVFKASKMHKVSSQVAVDIPNITLKGVSTHLLKNIDVAFPRNQLTVVTGLSGSGKSSLVYDTLFTEAQNRFSESLSTYTRGLIHRSNTAKLESSKGVGPAVAIGRKYLHSSKRSTVGTLTGLYEHFRLLFSRLAQQEGKPYPAQHFSFNHHSGACPLCNGSGMKTTCDPDKIILHPEKAFNSGVLVDNRVGKFYGDLQGRFMATLVVVAQALNIDLSKSWNQFTPSEKQWILYGTGDQKWEFTWHFQNKTRSGTQDLSVPWLGFCNYIDEEYHRKLHNKNIQVLKECMHDIPCNKCKGTRLKPELLEITFDGLNIAQVCSLSILECKVFFQSRIPKTEKAVKDAILKVVLPPILELLNIMIKLGVGYLGINRRADSLSGGEGQRLRLARAFSAELYGVTYILDEPTTGLHSKDTQPLISVLKKLVNRGNTVIVIEHDLEVIQSADYLLEMGPGPGVAGGRIIAEGTLDAFKQNPDSVTAPYLSGRIPLKPLATSESPIGWGVKGANCHTLKKIDVAFEGPGLIVLSGVSGSGKSTLLREVIFPSFKHRKAVNCEKAWGNEQFDQVFLMDQRPVHTQKYTTVATWTGLLDMFSKIYSQLSEVKSLKWSKTRFLYTHKAGMCPECKGLGVKHTDLDFLGQVSVVCETCQGTRYDPQVLEVKYQEKSMSDVLSLTVEEAIAVFEEKEKVAEKLYTLKRVGLGHMQLGQTCQSLSGGENQRLKLSKELNEQNSKTHLYLFDEPTTGLHFQDVERLIDLFNKMVKNGHCIMVVEHHPMMLEAAHQVIELGPEGGNKGGYLVRNEKFLP